MHPRNDTHTSSVFLFFSAFLGPATVKDVHDRAKTRLLLPLTFGYCWIGMRTLSESLMFLLLMTSRYFFMSPSFLSSSPSHFSISAERNRIKNNR